MIESALQSLSLALARVCTGAMARWSGARPRAAQRIYCANHTSHLDAVLLMASLEETTPPRPLAAADYWGKGLRRFWADRVFRTVFVERDSRQLNPLTPAFEALRQGDSLIVFPEGTRGPGDGLQPLKPGIYYLARAFRQVEIVPAWIDNAHRILPKGAVLPLPALCSVTYGTPLQWDGREDAGAFLARLRAAMEAARHYAQRPVLAARGAALLQP